VRDDARCGVPMRQLPGQMGARTELNTLRGDLMRAEVRLFHARAGAQAAFWLCFGGMVAGVTLGRVVAFLTIGGVAAYAEHRITPRLRRITRVIAGRWGVGCFDGRERFTLRFRGQTHALRTAIGASLRKALSRGAPILRTAVQATHAHGPWMLLEGEGVSLDIPRARVTLGGRYVVSVREVGSGDSVHELPAN
jgi:hypothetical protein